MATKYEFCHYTFRDGSRVTNVVQNYFCHEIFLQIKFKLSMTNFFITECLFSCSDMISAQAGHISRNCPQKGTQQPTAPAPQPTV